MVSVVVLSGCTEPTAEPVPDPPALQLVEVGLERGLGDALFDPFTLRSDSWGLGGHVVAEDLDGDGDIDLLFPQMDLEPKVYENDGSGQFALRAGAVPTLGPGAVHPMMFSLAVDLDGDMLPELISGGSGALSLAHNEGGMQWSGQVRVWEEPAGRRAAFSTASMADLDGDGDLDLLLPTVGPYPEAPPAARGTESPAAPDRILWWQDGALVEGPELRASEEGTVALASTVFDHDQDGTLEAFVPADLGFPTALWQRGATRDAWTDRAPALGADLRMGAMGVDTADLNGDGRLDLCITDTGSPRCLQSSGVDFVEAGAAFGLRPQEPIGDFGTVGWGITFADLERDGVPEIVQASGPVAYGQEVPEAEGYPSVLWRRNDGGGYDDISTSAGLDLRGNFPGVVAADFDGDRCLELLFAGPGERPRLFAPQRCSWGDATLVQAGPPGTVVSVDGPAGPQTRQVATLQGTSQGPGTLFFAVRAGDDPEPLVSTPSGR